MKSTAGKVMAMMIAVGVMVGGCATRESVRNAHSAADAADRHAGLAQTRAEEAYGVGNDAVTIGNNAMTAAQLAHQKTDANADEVNRLKRKIALLERKVFPRKKVRRHHAPSAAQQQSQTQQQAKAGNNS